MAAKVLSTTSLPGRRLQNQPLQRAEKTVKNNERQIFKKTPHKISPYDKGSIPKKSKKEFGFELFIFFNVNSKKAKDEKKFTIPSEQDMQIISSKFHLQGALDTTTWSYAIETMIKSLSKARTTKETTGGEKVLGRSSHPSTPSHLKLTLGSIETIVIK